jgi:predicted DNA-binding transcriptional regulator AlpA
MGLLTYTKENDPVLRAKQAAEYLGLKPRTLANWRSLRTGPAFVKIGNHAVGYRKSALEEFIK